MTVVDLVILALVALMALQGFARGFIVGAMALVGFVGGAFLGSRIGAAAALATERTRPTRRCSASAAR